MIYTANVLSPAEVAADDQVTAGTLAPSWCTHTHSLSLYYPTHVHAVLQPQPDLVPTREEPRLAPRGGSGQTRLAEVAAGVIKTFRPAKSGPSLD